MLVSLAAMASSRAIARCSLATRSASVTCISRYIADSAALHISLAFPQTRDISADRVVRTATYNPWQSDSFASPKARDSFPLHARISPKDRVTFQLDSQARRAFGAEDVKAISPHASDNDDIHTRIVERDMQSAAAILMSIAARERILLLGDSGRQFPLCEPLYTIIFPSLARLIDKERTVSSRTWTHSSWPSRRAEDRGDASQRATTRTQTFPPLQLLVSFSVSLSSCSARMNARVLSTSRSEGISCR